MLVYYTGAVVMGPIDDDGIDHDVFFFIRGSLGTRWVPPLRLLSMQPNPSGARCRRGRRLLLVLVLCFCVWVADYGLPHV